MTDSTLDKQIAEHHKDNRWSVKQADLERLLDTAEKKEAIFFDKAMIVFYKLADTEWTVFGDCAVILPEKFNLEIGRKLCRQRALDKLWQVVGYQVQCEMVASLATEQKGASDQDFTYVTAITQEHQDPSEPVSTP